MIILTESLINSTIVSHEHDQFCERRKRLASVATDRPTRDTYVLIEVL